MTRQTSRKEYAKFTLHDLNGTRLKELVPSSRVASSATHTRGHPCQVTSGANEFTPSSFQPKSKPLDLCLMPLISHLVPS